MPRERYPHRRSRHDDCTHHEVRPEWRHFNLDDDETPIESRAEAEAYWWTIRDCHSHEHVGQAYNSWSRDLRDDEPVPFVDEVFTRLVERSGERGDTDTPICRWGPKYATTCLKNAIIDAVRKAERRPQEDTILDESTSDDGGRTRGDSLPEGSGVNQSPELHPDDVTGADGLASMMAEDPARAVALWLHRIAPGVREVVRSLSEVGRTAVWNGLEGADLPGWEDIPTDAVQNTVSQARGRAWRGIEARVRQDDPSGLLDMLPSEADATTTSGRRTTILALLFEHGHLARQDFLDEDAGT